MFAGFVREMPPIGVCFDSYFKRKRDAEDVCRINDPHRLPLLIAISKGRAAQRKFMRTTNPIGVLLLIAQGC